MKKVVNKYKIFTFILIGLIVIESALFIFIPKWDKNDDNNQITLTPATIRGKVMTDLGEMIMANIIVESSDGSTKLYTTNVLSGYKIELEEGEYILHYARGMQFSTVTKNIKVENFKNYYLEDVRLIRLYNSEYKNYYAGDLHQHTMFSDGNDEVSELVRADIAAGLSWAMLSDHNDNTGISEWMQTSRLTYDVVDGVSKYFTPIAGVEITTGYGHYQSIGSSAVVEQWDIDLSLGENPYTEVGIVLREMARNGGIVQLNHPYSVGNMGFNNYTGLWDYIDLFRTIEIWNGYFEPCGYVPKEGELNQNRTSMLKWFELLNEGHRLFATGGTDLHSYTGSYNPKLYGESKVYQDLLKKTGQYAGMPTTFIYSLTGLNEDSILKAVNDGNTFITNGPLVFADVNGKVYGETTRIADGKILNLEVFSREGITKINVYKNGETFKTLDLENTEYNGTFDLTGVKAGDWIVVEVYGIGCYYAITNPIFFE